MKEEDFHIHDILIIGAGPCGLAVAARLHEHTSSALFTDTEHQRFHWLNSPYHLVS
jgi:2-polyprenyl-6-methoxyphenol hydroxylase-like FAD-dependent oxidoreductase